MFRDWLLRGLPSRKVLLAASLVMVFVCDFYGADAPLVRHSELQAVDEAGASAWTETLPFRVRGVITTDLDEMLDPTPHYLGWNAENIGKLGAEWQIVIQALDGDDFGGTILWLGQNYGNQPWIRNEKLSYSDAEWSAEVFRVSRDSATGELLEKGDLVEVYARRSLVYGGKRNINEAHSNAPENNFDIFLLKKGVDLPSPACLSLSDLTEIDLSDSNMQIDIFDSDRKRGGERYQGERVFIEGLSIVYANGWDADLSWPQRLDNLVTDGQGRYFHVRYPRRDLGDVPVGKFGAVGIICQESGSATLGTSGYELFLQKIVKSVPTIDILTDENGKVWLQWVDLYSENWELERSDKLNGDWSVSAAKKEQAGNTYRVQISTKEAMQFYRLTLKH